MSLFRNVGGDTSHATNINSNNSVSSSHSDSRHSAVPHRPKLQQVHSPTSSSTTANTTTQAPNIIPQTKTTDRPSHTDSKSKSRPKHKSKSRSKTRPDRPVFAPLAIHDLSARLFNPNFRPARVVKQPPRRDAGLAWSKLPPVAAELDERPTARVRRFRLWKDAVPGLRVVVLDPRKRVHLRRYQPFAIPAIPTPDRRKLLPLPLPTPTRPGSPTLVPDPNLEILLSSTENTSASPPGLGDRVMNGMAVRQNMSMSPAGQVVNTALPSPPLTPIGDAASCPTHQDGRAASHPAPPNLNRTPTSSSPALPTPPPTARFAFAPPPVWTPPGPPPPAGLTRQQKKAQKAEREAEYQRLLAHKWVLDQEHERRFRRGMTVFTRQIMEYQEEHTLPYEEWVPGKRWKGDVDRSWVQDMIHFFKDIRKKSDRIYDYLDPLDISPVPGRKEAHDKVRTEERRRRKKKERRERRKEREAMEMERRDAAGSSERVEPPKNSKSHHKADHAQASSPSPPPSGSECRKKDDQRPASRSSDSSDYNYPTTPSNASWSDPEIVNIMNNNTDLGQDQALMSQEDEVELGKRRRITGTALQGQSEEFWTCKRDLRRLLQKHERNSIEKDADTDANQDRERIDSTASSSSSLDLVSIESESQQAAAVEEEEEVTIRFGSLNMDDDTVSPYRLITDDRTASEATGQCSRISMSEERGVQGDTLDRSVDEGWSGPDTLVSRTTRNVGAVDVHQKA